MPVQFFSNADRERLSRYPSTITHNDLIRYFTLSDDDFHTTLKQRSDANRLGFALHLCALRYLGFLPNDLLQPPVDILSYLASQLSTTPNVLVQYSTRPSTRSEHLTLAIGHLGYRKPSPLDLLALETWLIERALEHDKLMLLFNLAAERLRQDKVIRPGVMRLERLVASVRQRAQRVTHERLRPLLTAPRNEWLDSLLEVDAFLGKTPLAWLQHQPSANSAPQILEVLAKIQFLEEAGVPDWDLDMLNPNRLKILARVAARSTNQALQRAPVERRYPTLVAFVKQALHNYTDEVVEMVDQHLWEAYTDARKEAEEAYLKAMRSTNDKLRTLLVLGSILNNPQVADHEVRAEVFRHTPPEQMQVLLEETQRIIRPEQDAYVDYFGKRYGAIRRFAREFWRTLSFASHKRHDPLLEAVVLLRHLDEIGKRPIPEGAPVAFIPEAWQEYAQHGSTLYRRYYELSVLWELRTALRSGDVFVTNSRRYADPESYLIPRSAWPGYRAEVSRLTGTPTQGEMRLKALESELEHLTGRLDLLLDEGSVTLREEDGKLIHTPLVGEERPERVQRLEDAIAARLPHLDITDLLIEVDAWVRFSKHFEHAGGAPSRGADLHRHLYASLLAQACNFDVMQMARSSGLAYHQLAWVNTWYIREETLKAATNALVNYQYYHPLARLWGGGMLSSSDGQRFPVANDARHARALSRYFGPRKGLTAYTWTSDQMSQYGTKLIPATMRDATFVLDEILGNETELPVQEHTTDTAGYTELIFALFDLLGLRFSPRIKDLGSQTLYRTDTLNLAQYPRMKPHLPGRADTHLFLAHWDDMLRFIGSLKLGWVTSSLMVAKLQVYPRQHLLTKVLQEYGRLPKTLHILNWYSDETLRRRMTRQLNKGEALHLLRAYLMVANKGILKRRQDEQLRHQISCLNLLTNAVVVWNTVYMYEAVKQLKAEGYPVLEEDLAHIWASRFEHINVYGRYEFNIEEAKERQGLRELRHPGDSLLYR